MSQQKQERHDKKCSNKPKTEKEMLELFKRLDMDNSGFITKDELITALKKMGFDDKKAQKSARAIMICDDPNRDGKITYEEFKNGLQL